MCASASEPEAVPASVDGHTSLPLVVEGGQLTSTGRQRMSGCRGHPGVALKNTSRRNAPPSSPRRGRRGRWYGVERTPCVAGWGRLGTLSDR